MKINLNTIKSKIIFAMVFISFTLSVTISGIAIYKSYEMSSSNAQKELLLKSQNSAKSMDLLMEKLEKSVDTLNYIVEGSVDFNNLNNAAYLDKYEKNIAKMMHLIASNADINMDSYFYFDPDSTRKQSNISYGSWLIKQKGIFVAQPMDLLKIFDDHKVAKWFYQPKELKSGVWSDLYKDPTVNNIEMITYSKALYKNNRFIGVAGMDISFKGLQEIINSIKVYKTGSAFLLNKDFNILSGKEFPKNQHLSTIYNGSFKKLTEKVANNKTGIVEYKYKGVDKIASFTHLNNGFTLFVTVPKAEVYQETTDTIILLSIITLIGMIITVFVAFVIGSYIATPLEVLTKNILQIANNDFTVVLPDDESKSEIGEVNRAFKKFTTNLKGLISSINATVVDLKTASSLMKSSTTQTAESAQQVASSLSVLSSGSQEQACGVNESLNNINKINELIKEISLDLGNAVKIAQNTENNSKEGNIQTETAVYNSKNLKTSTLALSSTIEELNNLSMEISSIIDLIRSIAGQTNLLALNASIEAARAGENGKGFAVVAEEVKKLAVQSAEATDKVTSMIKAIQSSTNLAVLTINKNVTEVEESLNVIEKTKTALKFIETDSCLARDHVEHVSIEIKNLSLHSDEVVKIVENISSITQEVAAMAEEISNVMEEQSASIGHISGSSIALNCLAEDLETQIAEFKI
ncbi:MAG: methyl-accepting chemotaxis protein [bacterium]